MRAITISYPKTSWAWHSTRLRIIIFTVNNLQNLIETVNGKIRQVGEIITPGMGSNQNCDSACVFCLNTKKHKCFYFISWKIVPRRQIIYHNLDKRARKMWREFGFGFGWKIRFVDFGEGSIISKRILRVFQLYSGRKIESEEKMMCEVIQCVLQTLSGRLPKTVIS
jgi:hypothetical protein